MLRKIIFFGIVLLPFVAGTVWWMIKQSDSRTPVATWGERKSQLSELDETLKKLAKTIQGLQGEGKCSSDGECHVVGLGAKTCEGYLDSLLYSTQDVNEAMLLEKVIEFNRAAEKMNALSFKVAPCGKPLMRARCLKNYCGVE